MTLKLNKVLEFVEVHVRAKLHHVGLLKMQRLTKKRKTPKKT